MWYIGNDFLVMTRNEYLLTLLCVYMAMCLIISVVLTLMKNNSNNEIKAWRLNLNSLEIKDLHNLEINFAEYKKKNKKSFFSRFSLNDNGDKKK